MAVVVTPCTSRKKIRPGAEVTASAVPVADQGIVASAWLERLRLGAAETRVRDLYAGRGFGLAGQAAGVASAKLCVVSAGLGLVEASQRVPSYGLTVTRGRPESLPERVSGEFDAARWFSAVLDGPYSRQWTAVVGRSGRILLALSRPYAAMVGASLLELDAGVLARLRIFGAALSDVLPEELSSAVVPYDCRLDSILPGTRVDFSQRALLHFVKFVLPNCGPPDRVADFAAVDAALQPVAAPERTRRPRQPDRKILDFIEARSGEQMGIARMLRALRDEHGVACEQARFARLYRVVHDRKNPA